MLDGQVGDVLRVLAFSILRPVAKYLPRAWAMGLADSAGYVFHVSPLGGRVRREMRTAFPSADANALALEWLRRPFRDYVAATQIVEGRDEPASWCIEQRNVPAALLDSDQSFIVATGHFSREAMSSLYVPSIIPKKLITVIASVDRKPSDPRGLRLCQQMTEMMNGIRHVRQGDVEIAEVGAPGVVVHFLKHLKRPGGALLIASDGLWSKDKSGGYERPFAGHAARNVALGTAWLSRMSQRPIVPCVSILGGDRRVIVEWGDPIPPADKADTGADARVMDAILSRLERAVGRHPGQYVLPIGDERRWSETAQSWVDLAGEPSVAQTDARIPAQTSVSN
ncbi:MAG: hypothetical protein AB7H66_12970 [Hyphomonadaceae bacterium]